MPTTTLPEVSGSSGVGATIELPPAVRSRLSSARLRLRSVDIALALARAILAASVVGVLLFTLDTTLEPPLAVLRAFALFSVIVAGALSTVFLSRPLRRPLSDDDVALLVESEYPELNDGLVSSVQLSRQLARDDVYTSRALIRSTIQRTADEVEKVDFGRVVRLGPLIPLWILILAFGALGVLILDHEGTAEYARIFVRRVVFGDTDAVYPKLVRLKVLLEDEVAVAKGDDLTIDVRVEKGEDLVESLTVVTSFDAPAGAPDGAQGPTERRELLKVGKGLYRKTYQNITDGFRFRVEAEEHGVSSARHVVRVVQRPRVERYEFVLGYPAYTGKPVETVTQPDLQVPAGTEISYLVVTNKPLESSTLVFERDARAARRPAAAPAPAGSDAPDAPPDAPAPATPATPEAPDAGGPKVQSIEGPAPTLLETVDKARLAPGGDLAALGAGLKRLGVEGPEHGRRVLLGHFQVSTDVRFRFALLSREPDGRSYDDGKKPVVFTVRAVADQRPIVSIPLPGRRKQVTPTAKMPTQTEARDDYGIASLQMRLRIETPGQPERPATTVAIPGLVAGSRLVKLPWVMDIADLRLQPGDILHYLAVASDQNIDEALRSRESREFEVQVVRPEDLERILQDRLAALKERLEGIAKEETEAKTGTDAFVAELGPKDLFSEDDKRRLQRLGGDQHRVTQRLDEVEAELADIKSERELNRLLDEGAMGIVVDLLESVRDLSDRASPAVSRELEDARQAAKVDDRIRSRVSRIPDLQQDIITKLDALAAKIGKWGDFTEVIQDVRDLMGNEEKVIDGTRRAAQQQHR